MHFYAAHQQVQAQTSTQAVFFFFNPGWTVLSCNAMREEVFTDVKA